MSNEGQFHHLHNKDELFHFWNIFHSIHGDLHSDGLSLLGSNHGELCLKGREICLIVSISF